MAVVFTQGRTNGSASGTTSTVTLLAAPTSGNLLVAFVSNASTTRPSGTPSGTGWSVAVSTSGSGANARGAAVWWKVAGAGESATITATAAALTAPWNMTVLEYSGVDTTLTTPVVVCGSLSTAGTAYTITAIIPQGGSGLAVNIAHRRSLTSSSAYSAHAWAGSSTGVTDRVDVATNTQVAAPNWSTAFDFIGTLPTVSTSGTVTSPASDAALFCALTFSAAAGGGSPVFVPGMGVRRRSIRRAIPATPNPADIPTPTDAPVPKVYVRREPRRWPMPRINPGTWVPPAVTPPVDPQITGRTSGRIRRAALLLRRPSSAPEPVPAQVIVTGVPAITQTMTARIRRAVTSYRRHAAPGGPVAAQDELPGPTIRRRLPIMSARRRASASSAAFQDPLPRAAGRRRAAAVRPRTKVVAPVPPQFNPPIVQTVFGRLRTVGRVKPRTKVVSPTQAQQSLTPNPAITATVFGRLRTIGRIQPRGKVSTTVPPQFNPPIVQTVFGRLRTVGRVRPRTKVASPTQAQQSLTPNPVITATVFGRLRAAGRVRPRTKAVTPVPPQFNPPIVQTVFGRLRTVGRVKPRTRAVTPVAGQTVTPNPAITATVFGRLRTVGRVKPRTRAVTPVPLQENVPNPVFGRLRSKGRTNRIPRVSKSIPPQTNPLYPIRPSVGGLSGLRRVWLKIRRKNAYPVPAQIVTLQGPLIITDSHGGVEADRASGTVISGTYGSSSSSTVSSGSSGGFTADPDADNVAPTYDSDSDSL